MIKDTKMEEIIDAKILACRMDLLREQERQTRELAGVVTWNTRKNKVRVRLCYAESPPHSGGDRRFESEPFCGGRRRCMEAEVPQDERLLAEFHTHPQPDAVPFAPPSAEDFFQLVLSDVTERSYVICHEGVYRCEATPQARQTMQKDLGVFYESHDYTFEDTQHSISQCRQPLLERINQKQTPYLYRLMVRPHILYKKMVEEYNHHHSAERAVQDFCQSVLRDLCIHVRFLPAV